MKKYRKKVISVFALFAILAGSICFYLSFKYNGSPLMMNNQNKEFFVENTEKEEEENVPEGVTYKSPINFEALREKNKDVIAWIRIPDTNIDYPIVWNGDNEYYLYHNFEGKEARGGAIFLDMDDKPDLSLKHNIVYGHNMKNKSMFQSITRFKEKDFFDKNRDIYIYTPEKEYHLKTITAMYTDAGADKRQTLFDDEKELSVYMEEMTKQASFRELPSGDIDNLWSFITCSYEFDDARTVLYAYEVKEGQ
jgi:sortase, srtB family